MAVLNPERRADIAHVLGISMDEVKRQRRRVVAGAVLDEALREFRANPVFQQAVHDHQLGNLLRLAAEEELS